MCDICDKAKVRLREYLKQLEDEFPGGTVGGVTVERAHHAKVATVELGAEIYKNDVLAQLEKLGLAQPSSTTTDVWAGVKDVA